MANENENAENAEKNENAGNAENTEKTNAVAVMPEVKADDLSFLPQAIAFNYEELKAWLDARLENSRGLVATEENFSSLKKTRADITSIEKKLRGASTTVKNALLAPFATFDEKVKELIKMCDDCHEPLDKQIKEIEENLRKAKFDEYNKFVKERVAEEFADNERFLKSEHWVNLVKNNESWCNLSKSKKSVITAINAEIEKCKTDYESLKANYAEDDEEVKLKAEMLFVVDFDLAATIHSVNAFKKERKELEEARRRDEEARRAREEEAKRRKAAEAARAAAAQNASPNGGGDTAMDAAKEALAAKRSGGGSVGGGSTSAVHTPPTTSGSASAPANNGKAVFSVKLRFDTNGDIKDKIESFLVNNGIAHDVEDVKIEKIEYTIHLHTTLDGMKETRSFIDKNGITYTKVGTISEEKA